MRLMRFMRFMRFMRLMGLMGIGLLAALWGLGFCGDWLADCLCRFAFQREESNTFAPSWLAHIPPAHPFPCLLLLSEMSSCEKKSNCA